jgi:hypothetical protein
MMSVDGYSPKFSSNFGMSEGSFADITGHEGSWEIGSFINHDKSGILMFLGKETTKMNTRRET